MGRFEWEDSIVAAWILSSMALSPLAAWKACELMIWVWNHVSVEVR